MKFEMVEYDYPDARKKIRLPKENYENSGCFFITICTFEKVSLLGRIKDRSLIQGPYGEMIDRWWQYVPSKFNRVVLGDYIIMPNHFHGILSIERLKGSCSPDELSIPKIIQWFKTMTANEFIRMNKTSGKWVSPRLWQRSYYDHIVRNDKEYQRISEYIRNNPNRWADDRFHP